MKQLTILSVAIGATILVGWVLNILELLNMDGGLTGELVLRALGVVVAPLGAIMGFFV